MPVPQGRPVPRARHPPAAVLLVPAQVRPVVVAAVPVSQMRPTMAEPVLQGPLPQ